MSLLPSNPDYAARVRASFDRQAAMRLIGARFGALEPGRCTLELPVRADICQQHGFVHGGIVAALGDSAGGYAAFSLMPADASVLTVEFKINLLAPARGERLVATGTVLKPGRTLSVVRVEIVAHEHGRATLAAAMQMTTMAMLGMKDAATND